jgi:hypothetical protein
MLSLVGLNIIWMCLSGFKSKVSLKNIWNGYQVAVSQKYSSLSELLNDQS